MRKVIYSEFVKVGEIKAPGITSRGRLELQEIGEAIFHQFSIDHEESENGPGNYPVAIIELPNGTVKAVHATHIRFIEPLGDFANGR